MNNDYENWLAEVEKEKQKVDLSPWMHMTAEELQNSLGRAFFDKYEWSIDKTTDKLTTKGVAYHDSLTELRDEKRTLEAVQYWIEQLPDNQKLKHLKDKITNIYVTPTVMAECGCCTEGGGEHLVTFEDGTTVQFDSHGRLEPTTERGGFRWLKR